MLSPAFPRIFEYKKEIMNQPLKPKTMFELPPLPYEYDALEPYIDAETMHLHHDKHHATYTANFNNALKGTPLEGKTIEEIFLEVENYPAALRNNAGGYVNHNLYWKIMGPKGHAEKPTGALAKAIDASFGSFDAFKEKFAAAALGQFGSGWAWLVADPDGKLSIISTANQDNPMMKLGGAQKGFPILLIDVWEHAYYLKYKNVRADYVNNFFNVINWSAVESLYANSKAYYEAKKAGKKPDCGCGCAGH